MYCFCSRFASFSISSNYIVISSDINSQIDRLHLQSSWLYCRNNLTALQHAQHGGSLCCPGCIHTAPLILLCVWHWSPLLALGCNNNQQSIHNIYIPWIFDACMPQMCLAEGRILYVLYISTYWLMERKVMQFNCQWLPLLVWCKPAGQILKWDCWKWRIDALSDDQNVN